jgi:hypothetical protein
MQKIATTITLLAIILLSLQSFDTKPKKIAPKYGVIILTNKTDFTTSEFSYAGTSWWISGETIVFNDMLNRRTVLRICDINGIVELDSAHAVKRVQ